MAEKLNDLIVARTEKTTPANADKIPILDSADTHKFRWLSWSGLLARLSALFDSAGTASATVSAHAAAVDPHPDYTTTAELAAGLSGKADAAALTAHAAAADPHPNYTTAAEAAAAAPVQTVAGKTGAVTLAVGDTAGLQTALDGKAAASHTQAASTITDFAEAVDDRVAALLVAGSNVTLSYNDAANTLAVSAAGGAAYTDEQAQDAVGGILADSATVDFTYDDAANTITAAAKTQQSITSDASGLKLSGDAAAPGNSRFYGTDAAGTKGWYAQPAASAPLVVTPAIAAGVVTVNAANSADVIVKLTQNAAVSSVAPTNVPPVCRMLFEITPSGGPWAFPLAAWPNGTVASSYYIYPAAKTLVWFTTTDSGATWTLETSAPFALAVTPMVAAGVMTVDTAGIGEILVEHTLTASLTTITPQNIPTACRIRFEFTQGAGGPHSVPLTAFPAGTTSGPYLIAQTGVTVLVWETADGGATSSLRSAGYTTTNRLDVSIAADGTTAETLANHANPTTFYRGPGGATWVEKAGQTVGDARGANAFDFQVTRSASTQIASGSASVAFGGTSTVSGNQSASFGLSNLVSGNQAFALGSGCSQTADYGGCVGRSGMNRMPALSFAAGGGSTGRHQSYVTALGLVTTNATATVMNFNANAASRPLIDAKAAWLVDGLLVAHSGAYAAAAWRITAVLKRNATGTVTLALGTVTQQINEGTFITVAPTVTADDTNKSLAVTVTGVAATTVHWTCSLHIAQVMAP